ncbi:hypothetical protein IK110_02565 [Candidatus Saccharibacteria bacterium]|nr:hypothetical protein [Candidatus Saccharibacteria bacterium]
MLDLHFYYENMEKLLLKTGNWVRFYALYKDLFNSDFTSPEVKKVFAKKYGNKTEKLMEKGRKHYKAAPEVWLLVRDVLKDNGVYDQNDARAFLRKIQRRTNYCDFRQVALRWTRAQLCKISDGVEVELFTPGDYLYTYEELCKARRTGGKKTRGLQKRAA